MSFWQGCVQEAHTAQDFILPWSYQLCLSCSKVFSSSLPSTYTLGPFIFPLYVPLGHL